MLYTRVELLHIMHFHCYYISHSLIDEVNKKKSLPKRDDFFSFFVAALYTEVLYRHTEKQEYALTHEVDCVP